MIKYLYVFLLPVWAVAQQSPELGINRPGLFLQGADARQSVLQNIRAMGAAWFRDGPSSGSDSAIAHFVAEVRQAHEQGLHVLVNIVQLDEDYSGPLTLNRCGWREKALSRIDTEKFSGRLDRLFKALTIAGMPVEAVEFGNEDDSHCYDADVPEGHIPSPPETLTWLRGYGRFLQTGARILRAFYPRAKVITFGMAHGGGNTAFKDPAQLVAQLRNVDGVNYLDQADGFGTHIYASPADVGPSAVALLRQDVWALGRNKPLWVTEFGFTNATAFPNKKGQTLSQGLMELMDSFQTFHQRVSMGPTFFFSYYSGLVDDQGHSSGMVDGSGNFVPAAIALFHRSWGLYWGSPDQPWATRRAVTPADVALIASYHTRVKPQIFQPSAWSIYRDDNPSLQSCRDSGSVDFENGGLILKTLPATRCRNKYATGEIITKDKRQFGFFEARYKIGDIPGLNNAFWLTTDTFEIDIAEVHYPNYIGCTIHNWALKGLSVGVAIRPAEDLSQGFHDYGILWTGKEIIFEWDGLPMTVMMTNGAIRGGAVTRFATALGAFAGKVPDDPAGHNMTVEWLKQGGSN